MIVIEKEEVFICEDCGAESIEQGTCPDCGGRTVPESELASAIKNLIESDGEKEGAWNTPSTEELGEKEEEAANKKEKELEGW